MAKENSIPEKNSFLPANNGMSDQDNFMHEGNGTMQENTQDCPQKSTEGNPIILPDNFREIFAAQNELALDAYERAKKRGVNVSRIIVKPKFCVSFDLELE